MTRQRQMVKFWLEMRHADQQGLAGVVEELRERRQLARTIREGIALVCDLRAGKVDVLFELFPWVKDALQPSPVVVSDQRLQDQIGRLEALLIAQGNVPIQPPLATAPAAQSRRQPKPKTLVEVTGSLGKASAETVAKNFLSSMKGLASGFFD